MTTRQARMVIAAADGIKKAIDLLEDHSQGKVCAAMQDYFPWDDADHTMTIERSAFLGYIFRIWQDLGSPDLSNDPA
jgi:hypothetical protein